MNEKTLKALKESIEHWKRLAKGTEGEDYGGPECALCKKFNHFVNENIPLEDSCKGCPVFQKTGEKYCRDTPYELIETEEDSYTHRSDFIKTEVFQLLAQEEVKFLESLLPNDHLPLPSDSSPTA
jgi:hypothetical protein